MVMAYLIPAIYDAALGVFGFALPLFLLDGSVDPVVMGSLLAMPALVQIIARIPAGLLAGRIGNVRGMLLGCAFTAASAALIVGSTPARLVAFVAIAQVLAGLGRASFWPANQAHLFETAGERIAAVIGPYNFFVTLGGITGPLSAGLLITLLGHRAPFWLLCLLALAAAALLLYRVAPRQALAATDTDYEAQTELAKGSLRRVVSSPAIWLAGLLCVASVLPFVVTTSFYPVLLKSRGLAAASISLLVTVRSGSVALFSLLTGSGLHPNRRPLLVLVSVIAGATGLALIPLLSATAAGVLPMLLLGLCGGAMHNVQMAVAGEAVGRRDRALAMAVVGSVGNVAMALTPLAHGWLASQGRLEDAFGLTGLVLAAAGLIAWRWSLALRGAVPRADVVLPPPSPPG